MAVQTSMLHIRVDDDIKEQATQALTAMGLSMSDAVRLFLRRVVVDQAFPLELKVPNAETRAAMEESRAMMASRRTGFASADELFADLEKNSGQEARRPASVSELHQNISERLAAAVARWTLRHAPTQGGHAVADCQRRTAGTGMAGSRPERGLGRSPRMPHRRRLPADLPTGGELD